MNSCSNYLHKASQNANSVEEERFIEKNAFSDNAVAFSDETRGSTVPRRLSGVPLSVRRRNTEHSGKNRRFRHRTVRGSSGVPKRQGVRVPIVEQRELRVVLRPFPRPRGHDPRLGVPPRLNRSRPLRSPPRVVSRERLLPLHRRRVRPGESARPEPTRPVDVPVAELQSLHFSGRHGDQPHLVVDQASPREPVELRAELLRRHPRPVRRPGHLPRLGHHRGRRYHQALEHDVDRVESHRGSGVLSR